VAKANSTSRPAADQMVTRQGALFDDPVHRARYKRDMAPTCGHPDRPIASRMMCQPCYKRWLSSTADAERPAKVNPGRGCYTTAAECHPDRPMRAHGMCQRCYLQAYRKKNLAALKAKSKEQRVRREYGLTLEDVAVMQAAQGGRCAICDRLPSKGNRMHIDHCHSSGVVRGLLCRSCNMYLGTIEARAAQIPAFLNYLEQHRKPECESQ
jgi:hypothetical protein